MRVAALAVVPRVIRALKRNHQAEARLPAPAEVEQPLEKPEPVVTSPAKLQKRRWTITRSVKTKSPWLCAWWSPAGTRGPPSHFGGSRSWAYLHRRSFPINNVDPTGLDIRVTFEDNTQEWMTPLDLYVYTGGSIKCPKKIRKIEFEGHATPQMQGANPWDRYSKNGGLKLVRGSDGKDHVNLLVNGQDVGNFANRLRGMLTSDATLVLGGCRTCAEPNSITHVLNTETGRPVTGNGNYVYGTYVRGGFLDGGFWGNPQTIGR